jgi:hypothetical protein
MRRLVEMNESGIINLQALPPPVVWIADGKHRRNN